jgi:type III secretory pathway component EscT
VTRQNTETKAKNYTARATGGIVFGVLYLILLSDLFLQLLNQMCKQRKNS